ncbi:hypothetical protein EUX98_g871 [Antrodiella citrinella]|uniref:Uncharacterized protein n=1 Tax=Antrodiella citrinella TaxID=2447956 RepID=A0A4S4NBI5_9APHY|nr:hypothetical protein EUX98_g871 [Antrodiella citrinella]
MAPYNFPQGPVNETNTQKFTDIMDINGPGADIAFVAYGKHCHPAANIQLKSTSLAGVHATTLFFLCLNLLWEERRKNDVGLHTSPRLLSWAPSEMASICSSTRTLSSIIEVIPVDQGNLRSNNTDNAVDTVVYITGLWFTDWLMVRRFAAQRLWRKRTDVWMPILYLASIVMSIFLLHQLVSPGGTLWVPESVNFALAYWSTSVANNLMLTLSIVGFLLYMRLRVRRAMGPNHNSAYLSISTILIESAFLYIAFTLVFLIPLAKNSEVNLLWFQVLPQVQFIAPLLIILRVAQGRALKCKAVDETKSTVRGPNSNPSSRNLQFGNLATNTATYSSTTINLTKKTTKSDTVQQEGQSVEILVLEPIKKAEGWLIRIIGW